MRFLQKPETKVSFIFLLLSSCWIIFSDKLLLRASQVFGFKESEAQTIKGLFYITIITLILFYLIKKYSRQLQRNYEEYRDMFDSHPAPMWIFDTHLKIIRVNDAAISKYGYSRSEFLSLSIQDIRPQEDVDLLHKTLQTITPGLHEAGIWRHKKKNGDIIFANITTHDITYNGVRCLLVMADDLTNLIVAKEQLQASELSLSIIINNTKDLIWSFDNALRLTAFNNAFSNAVKTTCGLLPAEGDLLNKMQFSESTHTWQHYYSRVLSGELFTVLNSYGATAQTSTHSEITFNPIINDNGKVTGAVCFARDITQKQKQEEKIKNQNTALKEIAFSNSHLLRRPLSNILGLLNILDEKNITEDMTKEAIDHIKLSAVQLDTVIKEIASKASQLTE